MTSKSSIEKMALWEAENISYFFNSTTLEVEDAGPLQNPIESFGVQRDEEGRLVVETVSSGSGELGLPRVAPGTVRDAVETARFRGRAEYGLEHQVIVSGIVTHSYNSNYLSDGTEKTT